MTFEVDGPLGSSDRVPKNRELMGKAGFSEVEILRAEVSALWDIVESLPVDTHDMEVHFWCDPETCYALKEDEKW